MQKSLHEECGICAIYNMPDAAAFCALSLHALQHRGQEACGIVSYDGQFHIKQCMGHVGKNFGSEDVIKKLKGIHSLGHVRYSTHGDKMQVNIQPIFAELSFGSIAIAHNGNLVNAKSLKKELVDNGSIFQSSMDSEIFVHLIATSKKKNVKDKVIEALNKTKGAFSIAIMTEEELFIARDPNGFRPLIMGSHNNAKIFVSETCALDIIDAQYERDIKPGELVTINMKNGATDTMFYSSNINKTFCIFEYIYFARPDSNIEGKHVYQIRKNIGIELANENNIKADFVIPVPDSGIPSALGFSQKSNIPFEFGIIKNHYIGRTFIEPTDKVRLLGVKLKHNANRSIIYDKEVIVIDDSIVRGTTSKKIIRMIRDFGAKKIHVLIASPPTVNSCYYGVDTPDKEHLIAYKYSIEEIRKYIDADSLSFISVDGLYRALGQTKKDGGYCDACFSNNYPIKPEL